MDAKFYRVFASAVRATGTARLSQTPGLPDVVSYWGVGFMDGLRFAYDYPALAFKSDRLLFDAKQDETSHIVLDMLAKELSEELHPLKPLEGEALVTKLHRIAFDALHEAPITTEDVHLSGVDFDKGQPLWAKGRPSRILVLSDEQLEALEEEN